MPDHPFQRFGPAEQYSGLKAANYHPAAAINNGALTAGVEQLIEVFVPEDFLCSTVHVALVGTAGVTLANCFAGLRDDQGNLVGVTADQSSQWTSTGNKPMALVTPVRVQGQRRWYVALLVGSAVTMPTFARGGNTVVSNIGAVAPFRFGTIGSGLTALPASIALGSVAAAQGAFLAGLS